MALTQVSTGGIKDGQVHTADLADAQITAGKLHADALDHTYTLGASGTDHYTFTGEGLTGAVNDATLYLTRGKTYRFVNGNSSGAHPFRIQSVAGAGGTEYNTGVTNNSGAGGSTIIFEVPHDAPDVLYYICTSHAAMNGIFYVTGALADGTVTSAKLAADAVTTAKIADDAITSAKIADNSILAGNIAADAVGSSEIADNAVDADRLQSNAVTTAKIAADAITDAKIADLAVRTEHIQTNNVTTAKINDLAVTTAKIADSAVTDAKINGMAASKLTGALPAISGASLTNLPGGGKIIQVKQAFKSSSFSSNTHLGVFTYITGLSLSMQVASNTSKILFLGTICYQYPHDLARGITFQLMENGANTSIGTSTAYASFKGIQSANYNFNPSHTNQGLYMLSFGYLYTPGNTNNVTYAMRATGLNTSANTSWYWRINEMGSAYGNGGTSHLTAMEVAP